jgi:hypothetical protein
MTASGDGTIMRWNLDTKENTFFGSHDSYSLRCKVFLFKHLLYWAVWFEPTTLYLKLFYRRNTTCLVAKDFFKEVNKTFDSCSLLHCLPDKRGALIDNQVANFWTLSIFSWTNDVEQGNYFHVSISVTWFVFEGYGCSSYPWFWPLCHVMLLGNLFEHLVLLIVIITQ